MSVLLNSFVHNSWYKPIKAYQCGPYQMSLELVSIVDVLGVMIWCKYFMEAQGYAIDNNLLYQDNKSTILLAKNGRMSAAKASRHIHHRFFLIADKIEKEDVSVEHQGTMEMWADGNTKPLQGAGFRLFRSKIMGIPENYLQWRCRKGEDPPTIATQAQGGRGGILRGSASVSVIRGSGSAGQGP